MAQVQNTETDNDMNGFRQRRVLETFRVVGYDTAFWQTWSMERFDFVLVILKDHQHYGIIMGFVTYISPAAFNSANSFPNTLFASIFAKYRSLLISLVTPEVERPEAWLFHYPILEGHPICLQCDEQVQQLFSRVPLRLSLCCISCSSEVNST